MMSQIDIFNIIVQGKRNISCRFTTRNSWFTYGLLYIDFYHSVNLALPTHFTYGFISYKFIYGFYLPILSTKKFVSNYITYEYGSKSICNYV